MRGNITDPVARLENRLYTMEKRMAEAELKKIRKSVIKELNGQMGERIMDYRSYRLKVNNKQKILRKFVRIWKSITEILKRI